MRQNKKKLGVSTDAPSFFYSKNSPCLFDRRGSITYAARQTLVIAASLGMSIVTSTYAAV